IIAHAHKAGITTFDTVFNPRVASVLSKLNVSNTSERPRVLLRIRGSNAETIRSQVTEFARSAGKGVDLILLTLDPEFQSAPQESAEENLPIDRRLGKIFDISQRLT